MECVEFLRKIRDEGTDATATRLGIKKTALWRMTRDAQAIIEGRYKRGRSGRQPLILLVHTAEAYCERCHQRLTVTDMVC